MPKNKDCTVETTLAIFDFQIQAYPSLAELNIPNPEMLALIKQAWLVDMVYEEYGMEEEDYIKAPGLESNAMFRQKAEGLAQLIHQDAMMMGGGMGMGF